MAALLTGCFGRGAVGVEGVEAGSTAIRVSNHVGTGELERVSILVDGEPMALSSIPPEGRGAATVGKLKLAPGPHSIAVRTVTRGASGDRAVVGAQNSFVVGPRPAAVFIDVRGGDPPAVALTAINGTLGPELGDGLSSDKDYRCGVMMPVPRAICRASVDLEEASRQSDVVRALCVKDRLGEMRRLSLVGEELSERLVVELGKQVDRCSGSVVAAPQPDGLTVIPPSARQ